MELLDYGRMLRERRALILGIMTLCVGAAAIITVLTPKSYTANAQLFVATDEVSTDGAHQDALFTQERVKTYSLLIDSPIVLERVIASLGLDTTPETLALHVSARAPLDTVLLDVIATASSAEGARALANSTAEEFAQFVGEIESTGTSGEPFVTVRTVRRAPLPESASSPRALVNLALGLLAGISVGVGFAVVVDRADTRVRSAQDISRYLNLSPLGSVRIDPREHSGRRRQRLRARRPDSQTQATFEEVRTKVQILAGVTGQRSILVTSTTHGEGRSAVATELAISLTSANVDVILVYADRPLGRLAAPLGIDGSRGWGNVLAGQSTVDQALQSWKSGDRAIRVLPAGPPGGPPTIITSSRIAELVCALEAKGSVVVIDSPPLLTCPEAALLATAVNNVIFVVGAGRTSRDEARRGVRILTAVDTHILGAVLVGRRRRFQRRQVSRRYIRAA